MDFDYQKYTDHLPQDLFADVKIDAWFIGEEIFRDFTLWLAGADEESGRRRQQAFAIQPICVLLGHIDAEFTARIDHGKPLHAAVADFLARANLYDSRVPAQAADKWLSASPYAPLPKSFIRRLSCIRGIPTEIYLEAMWAFAAGEDDCGKDKDFRKDLFMRSAGLWAGTLYGIHRLGPRLWPSTEEEFSQAETVLAIVEIAELELIRTFAEILQEHPGGLQKVHRHFVGPNSVESMLRDYISPIRQQLIEPFLVEIGLSKSVQLTYNLHNSFHIAARRLTASRFRDLSLRQIIDLNKRYHFHLPDIESVMRAYDKENACGRIEEWPAFMAEWVTDDGLRFVPITTRDELYEIGNRLRQCVGSYAADCIKGNSIIISVRNEVDKPLSTIEIFANAEFEIIEHKAARNKEPPKNIAAAAEIYQKALCIDALPFDHALYGQWTQQKFTDAQLAGEFERPLERVELLYGLLKERDLLPGPARPSFDAWINGPRVRALVKEHGVNVCNIL